MTCKPQIKSVPSLQNAISPRLERALLAVELAFDPTAPRAQRDSLGALIETRAILCGLRLRCDVAPARRRRSRRAGCRTIQGLARGIVY